MHKGGLNHQEIETIRAYLATLSREELCELMITKSQDLLDELDHVAQKAKQANSSSMSLLVATKKEVRSILGEEYFKVLRTLKK